MMQSQSIAPEVLPNGAFASLEEEARSLHSEVAIIQQRLDDARRVSAPSRLNNCMLLGCNSVQKVRSLVDGTIGLRMGAFLICVALVGGLMLMTTSSLVTYWIVSLSSTIVCVVIFIFPGDRTVEAHRMKLAALCENAHVEKLQIKSCWQRLDELKLRGQNVNRLLQVERLRLTKEGRLQLCAESNWRELRGVAFEEFLHKVFVEHGYLVTRTTTTGDQGVDLLLRMRDQKIAIQAKGYAGRVGNSAVQQVVAGRKFYDCNGLAVITNSKFTRHAKQLAHKTSCVLIDGENLSDLIIGRIYLHEMCQMANPVISMPPILSS